MTHGISQAGKFPQHVCVDSRPLCERIRTRADIYAALTMNIKEGLVFRQYNQMVSALLESNHALKYICHASDKIFLRIRNGGDGMLFSGSFIRVFLCYIDAIDAVNAMAWGVALMNRVET
jgi:hypothetical protein